MEGADVLRVARPSAADAQGPLNLPETPGVVLRGDADPEIAAALTRAIVDGDEHGVAAQTATLTAGVRLCAGGRCDTVAEGMRLAASAITDGRATATLEALLAT
jgi:anthranilate phosphoribosyltransferase